VNHIRHAFAADRSDGKIHIYQSKAMRRDFLERKAV
jgi:ribosomal protein S24E